MARRDKAARTRAWLLASWNYVGHNGPGRKRPFGEKLFHSWCGV